MKITPTPKGKQGASCILVPADISPLVMVRAWAALGDKEKREIASHIDFSTDRALMVAGLAWLLIVSPREVVDCYGVNQNGSRRKVGSNPEQLAKDYLEALDSPPPERRINFSRRAHNRITPKYAEDLRRALMIGASAFAKLVAKVEYGRYVRWIEKGQPLTTAALTNIALCGAHVSAHGDLPREVWERILSVRKHNSKVRIEYKARKRLEEVAKAPEEAAVEQPKEEMLSGLDGEIRWVENVNGSGLRVMAGLAAGAAGAAMLMFAGYLIGIM